MPKDVWEFKKEEIRNLTRKASAFYLAGTALMGVIPIRAFREVVSDLIQVLLLLAAATIPLMILAATVDPDIGIPTTDDAFARITARLDKWMRGLILVLINLALTSIVLILAKMVCIWFDNDTWVDAIIDRPVMMIAGWFFGGTLGMAMHLFEVYMDVHRYRNFLFWAKPLIRSSIEIKKPPPPS
jgi:hypothetical protein